MTANLWFSNFDLKSPYLKYEQPDSTNLNRPEISVLIPFYNAEKTLTRAMESISKQTFKNFECILINNNSTDNSPTIAVEFCEKDSRFLLISEEIQGVVYANNKGLKIARGKYIARMDADDWCYPERLSTQYDYLENHKECGIVACQAKYETIMPNTDGFLRYVTWSNHILDFRDIYLHQFIESPIINPTVMWRKEISDQFGSYENGEFPEDYELWLRWLDKGVQFHKVNCPLIKWYDSEYRLTRTDVRYSNEAFYKIKTFYLAKWLKTNNPFHPRVVVWGASKISRKRANLLEKHNIEISNYIDISEKRQLDQEIIYYKDIPTPDKIFVLVYLKEETMRTNTIDFLKEKGFVEGKNYLLVS